MKGKIIVVTSGKGGVGKTTATSAIGAALALEGNRVAVIDMDIGLRNLDVVMGLENRIVFNIVDVVNKKCKLNQAAIKDRRIDNLFLIPASQSDNKDVLTTAAVERVSEELKNEFDYVLMDSPAGIEHGALIALYFADEAIITTNPEVSSVRDSDRILGILQSKSQRVIEGREPVKEHLLITRYDPKRVSSGDMLSLDDIVEILAIQLLGIIPESSDVLTASNAGNPVILNQKAEAGLAYSDAVARLVGDERPLRFVEEAKKGLFQRIFK